MGNALVDISSLLAYTPLFLVSSAGTRDILRFICRSLAHYLTCGLVKAVSPILSCRNDATHEYATCQKSTVELAESWSSEILQMNKEMKAWNTDNEIQEKVLETTQWILT